MFQMAHPCEGAQNLRLILFKFYPVDVELELCLPMIEVLDDDAGMVCDECGLWFYI